MAFLFPAIIFRPIVSKPIVYGVYEVSNGTRDLVPKYWKAEARSQQSEVTLNL